MNKNIILAGVGVVGITALYFFMRNKKQSAETTSTLGKTDSSASTTTLGGVGSKSPNSTSSTEAKAQLKSKAVSSVNDLVNTPLGKSLSVQLINEDAKRKVTEAISNLSSGEKAVLPYIVAVDSTIWTSESYANALKDKFGSQAISLANSAYNKLLSASRFIPIATNQGTIGQRRDCRQEARNAGIKVWQFKKTADYVNNCVRNGGYDSQAFVGFNSSAFDTETEQFAFNGHLF